MNEATATRIVGRLLSAFPSSNADDGTVDLWVEALGAVDELDAVRACQDWIGASKFFPSIAEFREILSSYRRQQFMANNGREIGRGAHIPAKDGLLIAKQAYLAECRAQGRPPTQKILDGFDRGYLGGVKAPAS